MKAKQRVLYTKIFPFGNEKKKKTCSNKRYLHEGEIKEGNNGKKLRHLMPYYINVINRRYTGYKVSCSNAVLGGRCCLCGVTLQH